MSAHHLSQRLRAMADHTGLDAVAELLREAADALGAICGSASAEDAWIARKRETFPKDYAPERFASWAEANRHEFMRGWNARDLQGTTSQPAKRASLTDNEVIDLIPSTGIRGPLDAVWFARTVERAHGITDV